MSACLAYLLWELAVVITSNNKFLKFTKLPIDTVYT